ncbi:MAG TPA: ECF-type sigma factor [Bryobacteraceae bacterium]|jgi:RNA polymerase sigma factor (TIGR02999 family)
MSLLGKGPPQGNNLTELLQAWGSGDESALNQLTPLVYAELYKVARLRMLGERKNHTLQPSALVNELFVRLMGSVRIDWVNRNQFYAMAARLMRQILTDLARVKRRHKRGGNLKPVGGAEFIANLAASAPAAPREDLLAIDSALERLELVDPRRAKVVELRFYGGLENADIAAVLGVSEPTIVRDWRIARASLLAFLEPGGTSAPASRE